MKVAVVVPAAGSEGTLATTAFVGALAEGFSTIGVETLIVGLTLDETTWLPGSLGSCRSVAPWLPPTAYRLGDRAEAARRGILSEADCCDDSCDIRWRLELMLERALLDFAPADDDGEDRLLLAETRSLWLLRITCRVARRLGWKVVVISNEALTDLQIEPATRDDYVRCATRCAAGIWAFSEHLAAYWRSAGVPAEHVLVNPPAVRQSSFSFPPTPRRAASAIYIGNLAHREIGYLLDIAEAVAAAMSRFELTIYGDASVDVRRDLAESVSERNLTGIVRVAPPVAPIEVPAILARADVLLLPRSQGEFSEAGFPNKLGEYLASGRPVIATTVGDISKYLTDGTDVFLVEPDDTLAFANALKRVLASPALGDEIGAAGRRTAAGILRADLVAARVVGFAASLPLPMPRPSETARTTHWWTRLRALLPDPDLTRRDLSRIVHRSRRGLER